MPADNFYRINKNQDIMKKHKIELGSEEDTCYFCSKQDECEKQEACRENEGECSEFEEAVYRLTPTGIFLTVIADMGWDELLGRDSELAWKLYEAIAERYTLDKRAFCEVLSDFGWCEENDKKADIAFKMFVGRMKKHGHLKQEPMSE